VNISTKILAAAAVAGLVAIGGSAFTAAGLVSTASSSFVGGTVTHNVSGSTLTGVTYEFTAEPSQGQTNAILVTFAAGVNGKAVGVVLTGTYATTPVTNNFRCTAVGTPAANVSRCTPFNGAAEILTGYITDLTAVQVTIS
jgi:hypothetical protein